ncbi:hypothetical protein GGX14DRAFT_545447 [Mycena pura]|uniref:Uncharacterized protein n=1 Tax=Mycena pura TaxID=153505 RepID=A0AAD6V1T4_9AGAR|nr:hypothetical protein GGX14DRAFT_545447 [Mycena pura]
MATCIAQTLLLIMNFQGHVLDVANSVGPPVIGQTPNLPAPTNNQKVRVMHTLSPPLSHTNTLTFQWDPIPISGNYIFEAALGNKPSFFLSYAGSASGSPALFAQATVPGGSTQFAVNCVNNTAGYIIEPTSGAALTGWPAESGSTTTPVTFEVLTNRVEQIWSFVPTIHGTVTGVKSDFDCYMIYV